MQTGDLLLFESDTNCGKCISCWTRSSINHVGMIVSDLSFIDDQKGLFVIQSALEDAPDMETKKLCLGVQINRFEDIQPLYKKIHYRKLIVPRGQEFYERFLATFNSVKDQPYELDISVWLRLAGANIPADRQHTTGFTCSAFVAYMYRGMQILPEIDWTLIQPSYFRDLRHKDLESSTVLSESPKK